MTRFLYGGGGDGDVIKPTGVPYISSVALVYDSRTGGSQITDLQNVAGGAISQVTTDTNGQAVFYGPDSFIATLWLDFGGGVRWALSPKAVDLASTRAVVVQRTADAASTSSTAKAHLPYNTADPLEQALATALDPLVIPRFASSAARDAAFPAPANGDRCWRTDTTTEQAYNGTAWVTLVQAGAWSQANVAITPTSGTFNIGSGSLFVRYQIQGKQVEFFISLAIAGDTSLGSGTWTISGLPFTLASSSVLSVPFFGHAASGAGRFVVVSQAETSTTLSLWSHTTLTNTAMLRIGASPTPGAGTWSAGNFLRIAGTAEIA